MAAFSTSPCHANASSRSHIGHIQAHPRPWPSSSTQSSPGYAQTPCLPPYFGRHLGQRAEERGQLGRRPASRRQPRPERKLLHFQDGVAVRARWKLLSDELKPAHHRLHDAAPACADLLLRSVRMMIMSSRHPRWPSEVKYHPTGSPQREGGRSRAAPCMAAGPRTARLGCNDPAVPLELGRLGAWDGPLTTEYID